MNIFDFISQEQLENLPEEPRMAFAAFVKCSMDSLKKSFENMDLNEEQEWNDYQRARLDMMNVILAASKRFEIEPFASMQVPRVGSNNHQEINQFESDLHHYMTQIVLDNVLRQRSDSVKLSETARDRIRQHVHHLKKCVDESELDESKKRVLHNKILEFESALDKQRLSLLKVSWISIQILAIPGAMWTSADVVNKLMGNIAQTVAIEKSAEEDERKLPVQSEPKALLPPRQDGWGIGLSENSGGAFDNDLDDDVPF